MKIVWGILAIDIDIDIEKDLDIMFSIYTWADGEDCRANVDDRIDP